MDQKPFIGYPRAPQPKKGPAKLYQDTWLDDFFKGFLGQEQPSGSVFDEDRPEKAARNQIGQLAGVATDLSGPAKGLLLSAPALLGATGRGLPPISTLARPAALKADSSALPSLESFLQTAQRSPWDESRRAYNISTQDAMSEAVRLVGPDKFREMAKKFPISDETPEWSAISNEMVARQILDYYDKALGK